MKNKFYRIFMLSLVITTLGSIMDGDSKETTMMLRFGEFFAMLVLVFILISMVFYILSYASKAIKSLKA
jgi:hypothetical protein